MFLLIRSPRFGQPELDALRRGSVAKNSLVPLDQRIDHRPIIVPLGLLRLDEVFHGQQRFVMEKLARPSQILVCNFAATAADMPADSTLAREFSIASAPQSAEDIAAGRQLGNVLTGIRVRPSAVP